MANKRQSGEGRDLAPALSRGIKILNLVASERRGWTATDIGSQLGLAKSTIHGLCSTLVNEGLLERSNEGMFRLGLRLVDLAHARLGGSELSEEFFSAWSALDVFMEDASVLSVRDGPEVVYVACRNSSMPLGVHFRVGMRLPASCTATGKAMLSTLSDDEIAQIYNNPNLTTPTKQSVRSVDQLIEQLSVVRANGYSIDDGETRDHMCSFGAPVFGADGKDAVAGVAISFFRADLTKDKRKMAIAVVRELADTLSRTQGRIALG